MCKAPTILALAVLLTKTFAEGAGLSTDKYLNCLISYLNSKPGQTLVFRDGDLMVVNKKSDFVHNVQANVRAGTDDDIGTLKMFTCTADIVEKYDFLKVVEGTAYCKEKKNTFQAFRPASMNDEQKPVKDIGKFLLDGQKNNYDWSMMMDVKPSVRKGVLLGNPRSHRIILRNTDSESEAKTTQQDGSHWSALIDTNDKLAEGLAALAVKQMDLHNPDVRHTLNHIVSLQQQTKASGEIHFVLYLNVDFNNCKDMQDASCLETKSCQVIYVRKPGLQLLDGSKYIAIRSNNCTDEQSHKGSLFTSKNRVVESHHVNNELEAHNLGEPANKKLLKFSNNDYLGQKLVRHKKTKQFEGDSVKKLVVTSKQYIDGLLESSKLDKSNPKNINVFFPRDIKTDKVENLMKNVKVAKLAEESLEFIDDERTKRIIKIHSVKSMPRQIEIIYDFAYTLCNNDVNSKCILMEDEPFQRCKAVILGKQWLEEKKKISVSCEKIEESFRKKRDCPNDEGVHFRSDPEKGTLLDITKPGIAELTQTAISQYKKLTNSAEQFKLDQIVEVSQKTKPEDGRDNRYILKFDVNTPKDSLHCHATVVAPNLQATPTTISVSCMDRNSIGGLTQEDPKDPKYAEMATKALGRWYGQKLTLHKVIDVKTQVVAGRATYIEYYANGERNNLYFCTCRFLEFISDKPDINLDCSEVIYKGEQLRSGNNTSLLEFRIRSMADQALQKYEILSNSSYKHSVSNILSVSVESINGNLTKIMFEKSRTNCTISDTQNNPIENEQICVIDESVPPETCHSEIWEVQVLNEVNINVYCHSHDPASFSTKNSTPNDPNVSNKASS